VVRGEVQGVGFRDHVQRSAEGLGLRGWVRNRSDGSVECVAQGPRAAVEQLLAQLQRGPAGASVKDVETTWREADQEPPGFRIEA
jgi:acylphosphatase